jgi:hypothetical protein
MHEALGGACTVVATRYIVSMIPSSSLCKEGLSSAPRCLGFMSGVRRGEEDCEKRG